VQTEFMNFSLFQEFTMNWWKLSFSKE
jgi:hypothetical protein